MMLVQAYAAYLAVSDLMNRETDFALAHTLSLLKRNLQPHMDFLSEQEMKLVETFGKKNEGGHVSVSEAGKFDFADPQAAEAYGKRHCELERVEVKLDWTPVKIKAPEKIKGAYLDALEGLISFEAPETGA